MLALRRIPWLRLYFVAMALLFAALMALGIWRHRSAVPFWDMWDAYLDFYTRVGRDWHAWWEQDNEHRLIVSRLIFWVDLRCFHGSMTLLYILNAVFPLLIVACFVFLLRRLQPPASGVSRAAQVMWVALLVVLATSWVQSENFTWAFQSQFWLAYLLPLLAFALLAHARETDCRRSFWLACLAGFVAAGSMANGTLALALLAVQALLLRMRWRDVGVLALAAVLVLVLYRYDYRPNFSSPDSSRWLDLVRYVLLFLGGPWYFLLQKKALWPVMAAGAAWIVLALALTVRVLRQRPAQPYAVALLMLLVYIGAAALGAAYNRAAMAGVEQALSSRYLTPQLMAWAVALLLSVYLWPRVAASRWALGGYALIPLLLLPAQLEGIRVPPDYLIQRRLPALAVQLGVHDLEALKPMTYTGEYTFVLAARAKRERLTVFGEPDMQWALRHWSGGEETATETSLVPCTGAVEAVEPIAGERHVMRVRGWLYDPQRQQGPSLVLLSGTQQGRGAALGGLRRPDTVQPLSRPQRYSGFSGYLQTPEWTGNGPARSVTLTGWIDQQPTCALTLALPP